MMRVSFLQHAADPYDIIFLDPPYDLGYGPKVLPLLGRCLAPEGIILYEHRKGEEMPEQIGDLSLKKTVYLRKNRCDNLCESFCRGMTYAE